VSLIPKPVALYFDPESIADDDGARCGVCWKYVEGGGCVEVEGLINPTKGICGLYVHGTPFKDKPSFEILRVSKTESGYSDEGPTHCANCEEMIIPGLYKESRCSKVEGMVDGRGCCNLWTPK